MNLQEQINQLQLEISNSTLSNIEIDRLKQDLSHVQARVKNQEYLKYNPNPNHFNIPDRWQTFMTEIDFYSGLGKTWQQIFKHLPLHEIHSAIDLCPGPAPKIELGLLYSSFKGHVTLINNCSESLEQNNRFLKLFSPQFTFSSKSLSIFDLDSLNADLIAGNHIIDDLFLWEYCQLNELDLNEIYQNETCLESFWNWIHHQKNIYLEELTKKLFKTIDRNLKIGGFCVLTQYASYMETLFKREDISSFFVESLENLKNIFLKQKSYEALNLPTKITGHFSNKNILILKKIS